MKIKLIHTCLLIGSGSSNIRRDDSMDTDQKQVWAFSNLQLNQFPIIHLNISINPSYSLNEMIII